MDHRRANLPPPASPLSEPALAADAIAPSQGTAPRLDALLPGTRLEEFEVERVIGSSSFGLVYLANDESFERRVAIKEYLPDTLALRGEDGLKVLLRAASHADAFERGRRAFVEEAQLLARCSHPSLLHVLRQWEAHGTVYRAMPCYPGHSLLSLRQALDAPPDEPSLRGLLDGLLDALEVLHAAGALHREIAPAKILLLPDDRPVLMGPSAERRAIVGDQARALMTLLTPSFAPLELTAPSPERPLGPWTDLYALAAVVKYCLGGELPPPTSLYGAPMREAMGALAQRVRSAHPHLHYSASFLAAIDAALAPRPEDRPQNVAEFRSLLDNHPPAWGERAEREDTAAEPAEGADADADSGDAEPTLGPFYSARPDAPPSRWKADAGVAAGASASAARAQQTPASAPAQPAAEPPFARDTPPGPATPPAAATPVAPAAAEAPTLQQPLAAPPAEAVRPPPAAMPPRREPRLEARPAFVPPPRAPAASVPPPRHAVPRLDERAMAADPAVSAFIDRRRRARRRLGWFGGVLMLAATGAGIWVLDQQRLSTDAQTALAQAARQDGLTANVPTLPQAGEATPAAPVMPSSDPAGTVALPQAPTAAIAEPLGTPEPAAAPPVPQTQTPTSAAGTEAAAPSTSTPPPASMAEPVEDIETEIETEVAQPAAPAPRAPAARSGSDNTARSGNASAARSPVSAPTRLAADTSAARARIASPREACGSRTQFALYRCMQTQCDKPQWTQHAQCKRLRIRDEVD